MPVANGVRLRNAVFTINNPPVDENSDLPPPGNVLAPTFSSEKMRYLGYALERGASGTVHWQGYTELKAPTSINTIKVLLGGTGHIESRRGTAQQARDYFAEPGEKSGETLLPAKEFGSISTQGKRSDLEAVVQAVKVN